MKHRFLLISLIAAAVVSAAVIFGLRGGKTAPQPPAKLSGHEKSHDEQDKPILKDIVTERALVGESWDVVTATGKVEPNMNQVVKIGPRIAGRITTVRASVGDVVTRGQVLATMSSIELAQARAAYRQAKARVRAAEQAYDQRAKLAKLGAFSSKPVEEAKSEYASVQGELAQARGEAAQFNSDLVKAESELAQCAARLSRAKELYKDQIVSKQDLEAAEAEYKRDQAEVEAVKSRIRQAEVKVQQAEARAQIAKSLLNRERKILGSNILASQELQSAKAELTAAKLDLEAAADTIRVLDASPEGVGDTVAVTSPISGRVVERNVGLGEMVEPSSTLFTIMNLSDVWVEANIYEKDLAKVRKGQTARIRVNGYPDRTFAGKVTHIGDVLDSASRTAKVRCSISNPDGMLKPEMFVSVDIITARRENAVLVPKQAVLDDGGKKIVFTVCRECEEPDYEKKELQLGPTRDGKVEVLSGIEPGEEVVVRGQYQLKTALGSGKLEAGCCPSD